MTILEDLIASLPDDKPVRSVRVGSTWTCVCSHHCGISAALRSDPLGVQVPALDVDCLHQKSAHELAKWAHSTDLVEASIGVAAINSMLEADEARTVEINASEVLASCSSGKNVAVIGRFHFIHALRQVARTLWVIEQEPIEDEYPADSAADLLPQAEIVAVTASTLVNHTLDELLMFCAPRSTVIVLGPSAPFSPVLFDHGVSMICGACVVNESLVLDSIRGAMSLRQVQGVKLLTMVNGKKM